MEAPQKISQSLGYLKSFVEQHGAGNSAREQFSTCITPEENIIGQADVLSPMLSQLSFGSTRTQYLMETTMESLPMDFNKASVLALLDSMDTATGFLSEPISKIVSIYNPILSLTAVKPRLSECRLEKDRRLIRDDGPMLGMLSVNKLELKVCYASSLAKKYFSTDTNNKCLLRIRSWLAHESKQANQNFFTGLETLAFYQFSKPSGRALTSPKTKKLLECDLKSAKILCQAYHALPESVFSDNFQ